MATPLDGRNAADGQTGLWRITILWKWEENGIAESSTCAARVWWSFSSFCSRGRYLPFLYFPQRCRSSKKTFTASTLSVASGSAFAVKH